MTRPDPRDRVRSLLADDLPDAGALVAQVLPDAEAATPEPATRNATANELMLLARHYETRVREREEVNQDLLLESIRLYREATEADPESALAQSRLAGALIYLGDLDSAEAPIFKALAINPNLSEVQNTVGEFHWAKGLVDKAYEAWERAVELNPNNPEALANFANSKWFQLEVKGVRDLYWRALDLDPLNLERYGQLGIFLASENYFDEARQLSSRIEELFDSAAAFRVLAELEERLGYVDRSIAWTIRARDLEPDNPDHVWRLAAYYADLGDAETALRLDPENIGVLFKLRRFEAVMEVAELAMIDQPENLWIRAILAMSYNAVGRYESALHVLWDTGIVEAYLGGWRAYEEGYAFQALENALYASGQVELARRLARAAIEMGYTPSYHFYVAIYLACDFAILGEDDRAREQLERARNGLHVVIDPYIRDVPCFERFQDDPQYQETVRYFDNMRRAARERLPATLAEFGVSL